MTTATATTVSYGSGMCNNSTLTTVTTDSGCVSSGFTKLTLNGNPICVKNSSCPSPGTYVGTSTVFANGCANFLPRPHCRR
ncbi:MAG: hypothetical protein WDM77_16420 [Steroidobacteraceae bacterium]